MDTTTLRMLAGLEHPTGGRILIGGKDVTMPATPVAIGFKGRGITIINA
ncbi:MAG TPA: hypothetical protein VL202_09725 [Pararhizobium sp.]|nr:hypothetical protein [Pararhizobium sp.]HTO31440.1 hypothetical protein [Pararhizobium sp.]